MRVLWRRPRVDVVDPVGGKGQFRDAYGNGPDMGAHASSHPHELKQFAAVTVNGFFEGIVYR